MRKGEQISAALFLLLGIFATWEASKLTQSQATVGPGPSFMPTLLGIAMCVLSLIQLARSTFAADSQPGRALLPDGVGRTNIASIVGGLAIYLLLLEPVGYVPMTAALATFLLWRLGRHRWQTILTISLAVAFLGYGIFVWWLRVPLPRGVLALLGIY